MQPNLQPVHRVGEARDAPGVLAGSCGAHFAVSAGGGLAVAGYGRGARAPSQVSAPIDV